MSNEILSMISHEKIDILITQSLEFNYKQNQHEIEIKEALQMLQQLDSKYNSYIDKILLLNHVTRKICKKSNTILKDNRTLDDYKYLREQISQKFYGFSFNKAENAIQEIIIIHLSELLYAKKYSYYEELSAVNQYFTSLAVLFGIEQTTLSQDVTATIDVYQQSLGDKISHCFKRGKTAFQYLSKYKIINIELLNIALEKAFGESLCNININKKELYTV